MYNHYIGSTQGRFEAVGEPSSRQQSPSHDPFERLFQKGRVLFREGAGEGLGQSASALLKRFHLDSLDTGDILLALIVLFLVLDDGDSLDLLIALGLMILFSLGEK